MGKNNNISINDIARIRKIINLIINILEDTIDDFSSNMATSEENKEMIKFLIGSRENVVSIITKLTNLLVKVIPLEEKIGTDANIVEEKLTNDDMEIFQRYIDKCNFLVSKKTDG